MAGAHANLQASRVDHDVVVAPAGDMGKMCFDAVTKHWGDVAVDPVVGCLEVICGHFQQVVEPFDPVECFPGTRQLLSRFRQLLVDVAVVVLVGLGLLGVAGYYAILKAMADVCHDVYKRIEVLSGGQRSRIALARLTLQGANLLVLDEPTNHLDITSQEVLEDVLTAFPGTVLLVTHDRYLVDAVATQVWMIDDGELRAYEGNYTAYLAAKAEEEAAAAAIASNGAGPATDAQVHRERAKEERRQRKQVEARAAEADRLAELIEAMEGRLAGLGDELSQASAAQDARRVEALGREYQAVDDRLHQLMEEWAELAA